MITKSLMKKKMNIFIIGSKIIFTIIEHIHFAIMNMSRRDDSHNIINSENDAPNR